MTDAVTSPDQPEISPPAAAELAAPEPEVAADVNMLAPGAAAAEPQTEPETEDTRTARQRIVDHLLDTEGPQHVTAICQGTGLSRAVVDPLLSRMTRRGQLVRVAPATYELAPEKAAPELPPAPAEAPRADGIPAAEWLAWLWDWYRTRKWAGPGKPPDKVDGIITPNCAISLDVFMQFQGELSAVLKHQQEDAVLRDQLIAAANGNAVRGSGLNDVRPLRVMLASGIDMATIEQVIRGKHDRRNYPKNPPLQSWAELMKPVAEHYGRFVLGRKLLERWRERLADPSATTDASPTLKRALSEIAPAPSPARPAAVPGAEGSSAAAMLLERFGAGLRDAVEAVAGDDDALPAVSPSRPRIAGSDQILANFRRSRPGAASAAPPPVRADRSEIAERVRDHRQEQGARPVTTEPGSRPWFAPGPQQQSDVPDETWRFLLEGFSVGNMPWGRRYGPAPEMPGCRVPGHILREFGYFVED